MNDPTNAERDCEEVGADALEGEAGKTMTYIMTDKLVRREVGKLLRR